MSKKFLYITSGIIFAGILAFAYYAISPLFINIRVDEVPPGQDVGQSAPQGDQKNISSQPLAAEPRRVAVMDTPAHPASGFVRVVEADSKKFIRYEDYKTINGPDIYVYLAKDINAQDYVDLGRVRATEGNVNYEIPSGIDPAEYPYVLTWCKAFGVLFNYADVSEII